METPAPVSIPPSSSTILSASTWSHPSRNNGLIFNTALVIQKDYKAACKSCKSIQTHRPSLTLKVVRGQCLPTRVCVDVSSPANTKTIPKKGRAWDRAGWADTKCFPASVPWSWLSEQHQSMGKSRKLPKPEGPTPHVK